MFAKVEPFSADETARYVAHRLKVAGYNGGELFTSGAMEIIKDRSRGVPRNINRLCFSALSLGCAMGRKRIDTEMMGEVVADLDVESHERDSHNNQLALVSRVSSPPETNSSPVISYPAPPQLALTMGCGRRRPSRIDSDCRGIDFLFPCLDRTVLPRKNRGVYHHRESVNARFCAGYPCSRPVSPPNTATVDAPTVTAPPPAALSVDTQAAPDNESKTMKVMVRPGETLQQIALRTLGQDDSQILKQIQRLNPRMTNPDHIEADEEIRLPQISKASTPPPVAEPNDLSRKN